MVKALFDTNILIDYLRGIEAARSEIRRYDSRAISIVTWMEVMVGAQASVETATKGFLEGFSLIPLGPRVAERAVVLRRDHKIKLSDAIVWASAQVEDRLLVTRDTKGFPPDDPGVRMPYVVSAG